MSQEDSRKSPLLYTNLLTLDNKKIVIPNSQLAHSTLVNYSSEEIRRVDLNFDVIMGSDTELVKKVIMEEALSNPYCLHDIPPFVIAGGNPCRVMSAIDDKDLMRK